MEEKLRDLCGNVENLYEVDWSLIPDSNRINLAIQLRKFADEIAEYNDSVGVFGCPILAYTFIRQDGYYDLMDCYGMIQGGLSIKDGDEIINIFKAPNAHEYRLLTGDESFTLVYKDTVVKTYCP
jgi:hypothetical protein